MEDLALKEIGKLYNKIEAKLKELKVNNEFYLNKFNKVKENFGLGKKYNLILKDETSLLIDFETGEFYTNGTPKHTHIKISYENFCGSPNGYSFSINPYTAGSFDPTGSSYLVNYYKLVGFICSNTEFTNTIKSLMHEYTKKNEPIRTEIYEIKNKIREIETNEAIRIATEKENKKISKILEKLSNSEYAIINKKENSTSKFVYRRSFVEVVKCGTLEECENELNELNFKAPWGKYAIVNVKKLKF